MGIALWLCTNSWSEHYPQITSARITLRAGSDTKGKPFIEVEDNGPGIPTELLEEIFIPFFTTKPKGSGVGLSISKQIMQLHGGDIRVSTSTGGGARFVLEFWKLCYANVDWVDKGL